jgi:hypothetical protein
VVVEICRDRVQIDIHRLAGELRQRDRLAGAGAPTLAARSAATGPASKIVVATRAWTIDRCTASRRPREVHLGQAGG